MTGKQNILVIMGSPRKGNTYRKCKELCDLVRKEVPIEVEYLWLKDQNLLACKGCLSCFSRGEETCPNHDDAPLIEQKMRDADMILFASPVYGMNVTGQMKIFIDRFSYIFHRPRFFEKKAFLLVTTGVLGHSEVLEYLDDVARLWGFEIAGAAGFITPIPTPRRQEEKNRKALKQAAAECAAALRRPTRKSPGLKDLIRFHGQRAAFSELKDIIPTDYQYWKDQGWLERGVRYFIDIPVNPVYHGIGLLVEWIVRRQVRRDQIEAPGE